jgi:hypothetical protein
VSASSTVFQERETVPYVNIDRLVSMHVLSSGKKLGRIQALHAEQVGNDWVITEVHVGAAAALERFARWIFHAMTPRFARHASRVPFYCVPWDKIDIADPRHPRLLCEVSELRREGSGQPRGSSGRNS